jgi:hypothetical protein
MSPQRKRMAAAAVMMASALAFAACDNHGVGKGSYGSMTTPTSSALSGVVATIGPSGLTFGLPCLAVAAPGFNLRITSSSAIDVNQITLRLGDGASVGGPSVTFPSPVLTSQFGGTQVAAGTTRVFVFNEPFGCSFLPTQLLFADLLLTDRFGNATLLGVSTTLK